MIKVLLFDVDGVIVNGGRTPFRSPFLGRLAKQCGSRTSCRTTRRTLYRFPGVYTNYENI
jgi:beta-phosphoglucomutase-like phosphatase (HAD superfamily)